jgi:methylglutaconyl-CoA hydratase
VTELVHRDVDRGVATLTLDSQHNRNALSAQLMAELRAGLAAAVDDDGVRVVVLTHAGSVFCSGADLKESRTKDLPITALPGLLQAVWDSPKPVVARVAGPVRAGGLGLLAACDLALSTVDATYAFTEVRLGIVPAVISATVLPRMLPRAAYRLYLTGEVFDGTQAAAVGLVDAAVPGEQLDEAVERHVEMLLRAAPHALAVTKDLLHRRLAPALAADLAELADLSARHFGGAEGKEGMAAFAERRDPAWVPLR